MDYTIPTIDLSRLTRHSASIEERQSTASEIAHALEHVGSFYIEGSGIDRNMIEEWLNEVRLLSIELSTTLMLVFTG